ncbi:MAG TPA: peptide ABC transporter substrate-binding protein [Thermomicrobiales bacterium]
MANRDRSEHDAQIDELMHAAATRNVSRRDLVKRAAALGAGASVLAGLNAVGGSAAPAMNRLKMMNAALQDQPLADEQVVRLPEGEPVYMDPGITGGGKGLEQLQNMFEGLVYIDQRDGSLQMGLAEKMEPNADDTVYTFTLRDGLKWSDGTPLTAHDFEWSWQRVLDPATKSEYTTAMFPLKNGLAINQGKAQLTDLGVKATDDKTLVVTLESATPYFPLLAATWTFYPVPKHVIDKAGDAWVEAGTVVGNGPYVLTAWEHNQTMTLEQNPNYYGDKPTITKANYTLFDDNVAQALVPFENDELDQAQVSEADLDRVKGDPTLSAQMQIFPRSGTKFLICDTTNPPTDNVKVRQALSMAISRDTLANGVLKGLYTPAPTMLPPDIPGNDPTAGLGEDVAKAKQLLAEAGFPDGKGFPNLQFTYISTESDSKNSGQYLQNAWKQNLGIDVTLNPMEQKAFSDWADSLQTGTKFNLYILLWGSDWGDPANWHNQLFDSNSDATYHAHWKNDQFDQIVRAAVANPDPEARIAQYKQAEKILNQDAAYISLYHLNRIYVIKPNIKGVYHYPILGRTWLKYMSVVES